MAVDTKDNVGVHTEDAEGVDAEAEDKDHLHRRHRTQTFLRSEVNLHPILAEEQEYRHHQIL